MTLFLILIVSKKLLNINTLKEEEEDYSFKWSESNAENYPTPITRHQSNKFLCVQTPKNVDKNKSGFGSLVKSQRKKSFMRVTSMSKLLLSSILCELSPILLL